MSDWSTLKYEPNCLYKHLSILQQIKDCPKGELKLFQFAYIYYALKVCTAIVMENNMQTLVQKRLLYYNTKFHLGIHSLFVI